MTRAQMRSLRYARGIAVEVGTWRGELAEQLLRRTKVARLYCVDPYRHFDGEEYQDGLNDLSQKEFDDLFASVNERLTSTFGDRVEFLRAPSVEAATVFPDESIDFVYIDGNHDYAHVLQDLQAWYPKVKKGGTVCGDDVYSADLREHDADGNVTRVWAPGCWGKYGTYKALVDFGKPFRVMNTQFMIAVPRFQMWPWRARVRSVLRIG